jgi:hypothetical protein
MSENIKQPGLVGPVDAAQKHLAFVIAERLDDKLNGEQAEQTLEAPNGFPKDE